jgi:hypothetical protein
VLALTLPLSHFLTFDRPPGVNVRLAGGKVNEATGSSFKMANLAKMVQSQPNGAALFLPGL